MDYRNSKIAVIHIGTMKVGTTSIQKFMAENKEKIYADTGLWPICQYTRTPQQLQEILRSEKATGKSLMICDEGFWHHAFVNKRVDLLGIRDILADYSFKVVLYARRPAEFLESWYLQGLKSGTGAVTLDKFLNSPSVSEGLNFQERLPRFVKTFGDVTVRAYERSQLVGGDAITDFLSFCGILPDGFVFPAKANETPDPNALMMARLMREFAPQSDHENLRRATERLTSKERYSILTSDEIVEINRRYSPQIRFLQEQYGRPGRTSFFDEATVRLGHSDSRSIRRIYDEVITEILRNKTTRPKWSLSRFGAK
ncbi:hypothetical protein GR138_29990 [Shinella kummerowiae]|jgi:hypothetical protein|uniref:Sulfotransferase domain-containing protein n=1 Tax=Shinella kummerowiae TaxID=417745 RepID=A0A6N8SQD4_9HYPH|nr:hypothetical protein [Shinella kummerowiae]MXN49426.1 hypothetical protein [Shinella kummerowiae]